MVNSAGSLRLTMGDTPLHIMWNVVRIKALYCTNISVLKYVSCALFLFYWINSILKWGRAYTITVLPL